MSHIKLQTPYYPDTEGSFSLSYHLEMMNDEQRVTQVLAALQKILQQDSVFCELGCGAGFFCAEAAKICGRVYAVESDGRVLEIARKRAKRSGVLEKIEFIEGDARIVDLPEKVDVVMCEMMSTWLVNEPQVEVVGHARRSLLKEGGICTPALVVNLASVVEEPSFGDFAGVGASRPLFRGSRFPRVLSETRAASAIDLMQDVGEEARVVVEFEALVGGLANGACLSSVVEFAPGVTFYSSDTLMPVTVVPLEEEVSLSRGERFRLLGRYRHRSALEESRFWIERR